MNYPQELIDWFNNYFDNCYYVKHNDFPESLFMFYDVNYIRQLKLAQLEGKNIEKSDITGECLFEQDWKYKLFRCDYNLIWSYLRDNYSFNYDDFKSFVFERMEEHLKMKILTLTDWTPISSHIILEDHSKMIIIIKNERARTHKLV